MINSRTTHKSLIDLVTVGKTLPECHLHLGSRCFQEGAILSKYCDCLPALRVQSHRCDIWALLELPFQFALTYFCVTPQVCSFMGLLLKSLQLLPILMLLHNDSVL